MDSDAVQLDPEKLDDNELQIGIPSTPALELDDPQPNKELLQVARDDSKDLTLPRLDETERRAMQSESQALVAQLPGVNSSAPSASNAPQVTGQRVVVANRGAVALSVDWVKPAQGYTHRLVSPDSGSGSPVIWVSKQDGLR
jgi:hypothetical protein